MGWVKVAWIDPLFAALNKIAPNRAKDSDGTVGNTAHQSSPSGHNPDDTPGSKPEREDPDNIPEVRAADATSNLRSASVTMEDVVQAVLRTPAERDRLIYIIFNRRIWRKSNGWRQETYTGSDPHDTHAHFSGDPASDEDSRPWNCIIALTQKGNDVGTLDGVQGEQLTNLERLRQAIQLGDEVIKQVYVWDPNGGHHEDQPFQLNITLHDLQRRVTALEAKPTGVTQAQIDALVNAISAKVIAADTNELTPGDLDNVKATVREAIEGVTFTSHAGQ